MSLPAATRVAVVFNDDAGALTIGEEKDRIAVAGAATAAAAVAKALVARGHLAVTIPARADPIELAATLRASGADVVFNLVEGFAGKARLEGAVSGLFDLLAIRYTGNPPATAYLAQDKERAKAVLRAAGVPVPAGTVLAWAQAPLPAGLGWPLFVKLRYEDASHGISARNLCADEAALRIRAGELIESYRQDVLVEDFLPGREFNAAILDEPGGPTVLPIAELDYSKLPRDHPPVLTYDAKWLEDSPAYLQTPVVYPKLDQALWGDVVGTALKAFHALGCRGYARVDLRLDRDGRPVVLEVNPNPDISPDAGFARAASRAGIGYEELVDRIVRTALGSLEHDPARRGG